MPINYERQNIAVQLRNGSLNKVQIMTLWITDFKGLVCWGFICLEGYLCPFWEIIAEANKMSLAST